MRPSARRRRDGSKSRRQGRSREQGRSQERGRLHGWQREQRDDLTLSEARHILWEWRAVVAGCTLLFLVAALSYGFLREPVYRAEARLSVRSEEGVGPAAGDEFLSGLQDSVAMRGLNEEAAARAGWEAGQRDFTERLDVERTNDEEIKVGFWAPTPYEAQRGANAYTEVFVERVREFEGRLVGGTVAAEAEIEEPAGSPERPSGPNVFLVAIAAAGGGLLVGGIGALFLEGRARRWRGSRDAELTLRAPVLGVIPDYSDDLLEGSLPQYRGIK